MDWNFLYLVAAFLMLVIGYFVLVPSDIRFFFNRIIVAYATGAAFVGVFVFFILKGFRLI